MLHIEFKLTIQTVNSLKHKLNIEEPKPNSLVKKNSSPVCFILLFVLAFSVGSCLHEPIPSCKEVTIKVEVVKADSDVGQSNGTLIVTASGPSKFFTYSINDGEFQASNKFIGLDSGKYKVTAKNSWGCTGAINIVIAKANACDGIVLNTVATNTTLGQSTGSIVGTLVGGSGTGYMFNVNTDPFQTSSTFNGLTAGNYSVTAKNTQGCIFTSQVTVGATDPCLGITVLVSVSTTNPTINQSNGIIAATATGGSGFTFSLNNGAFQSIGSFTGLATGNYSITAKNAAGCIGTTR